MSFPLSTIAGLLASKSASSGIVAEVRSDGTVLIATRVGGRVARGTGLVVGDAVTLSDGIATIAPTAGKSYPV